MSSFLPLVKDVDTYDEKDEIESYWGFFDIVSEN